MLGVMLNLVLIVGMIAVCFFLFQINEKLERLNNAGGLGSTKKTG